jgi:uncharacterized membrane protein
MRIALVAALAAAAIHAASGHAAAGERWLAATVAAQWAHFVAAGIWFGGLVALLLAVRGGAADAKAGAARRFSRIAAAALVVVGVTGVIRSLGEVARWADLVSTPYGIALLAKMALTLGIVLFAAANHWRSLAVAATDLQPLRRTSAGELTLAGCAFAAAAVLGSLPPPAALTSPPGLVASGSDFATTVRVRLTAASNQPGPNRFIVRATDYDSGRPVDARRVRLQFTSADDPDLPPTFLDLARGADESFVGSGANVAFGGRWRVVALLERAGDATEVAMELDTAPPPQFVAVAQPRDQPRTYRVQVLGTGHVWISPAREQEGHTELAIAFWDLIQDPLPIDAVIVTVGSADSAPREQAVTRTGRSTFVAAADLHRGANRITVVGRAANGRRIRAVVDLDIVR